MARVRKQEDGAASSSLQIEHDISNENLVLAAALTDPTARQLLLQRIKPDTFITDIHSVTWRAIEEAHQKGLEPDLATLHQLSGGVLDQGYLDNLIKIHPTAPVNIRFHLEGLLWDSTRAKVIRGPLNEFLKALRARATNPQRLQALADNLTIALKNSGSRKYLRDSAKLVKAQAAELAKRATGIAVYPLGIPAIDNYGINDKDEKGFSLSGKPLLIPGAAPGKLSVITGISGGGKSTVTALIALNLARQGRKILFGSWEMAPGETLELMACMSAGLSRSSVRTGNLKPHELVLLETRMHLISQQVKFMDQPFMKERGVRRTHDEVLDEIHGYIADAGCEVAIFDLWRRAFTRLKDESDEAEALYRQQAIAEETGVHCLLVQQQRLKDIEKRANSRPTREGIKGSSAWVDVADTIIGVHLPFLMKAVPNDKIETIILKQRYGRWPVAIEHDWDGDHASLSNGRVVQYEPGNEQDGLPPSSKSKFFKN